MIARKSLLAVGLALLGVATCGAQLGFAGIGVMVSEGVHGVQIDGVLPDSPAAKAKLTAGLIITRIDRTPTAELTLEECVRLIRGAPGTPVFIEVTDPVAGAVKRVLLIRMPLGVEE